MASFRNKFKNQKIPGPMDIPKCWPKEQKIDKKIKWESVTIATGFSISEHMNKCGYKSIYQDVIPQILLKNPLLKNPNEVMIGTKLDLPVCKKIEVASERPKEEPKKEPKKESKKEVLPREFKIFSLRAGLAESKDFSFGDKELFYEGEIHIPLFLKDIYLNGTVGSFGSTQTTSVHVGQDIISRNAQIFYGVGSKRFHNKDYLGLKAAVDLPVTLGFLRLQYTFSLGARKLSEMDVAWGPKSRGVFGYIRESALKEESLRSIGLGVSF